MYLKHKTMKKTRFFLFTVLVTLMAFATIYESCKKDPCSGVACLNGGACSGGSCICASGYTGYHCETKLDPCAGVTCYNGGYCNLGSCVCPPGYTGTYCETHTVSTLTYHNATFTPIYININGTGGTIPAGGDVTYSGAYGDVAAGTASTSGSTTSGTQVGLLISWTLSNTFPAGNQTINLNVTSDYFFLKLKNNSVYNITQVYVNHGLMSETLDNISVPNTGITYNIGYYRAWTNSNIYLTAGSTYWSYNISLPFTTNQSYTFTAL